MHGSHQAKPHLTSAVCLLTTYFVLHMTKQLRGNTITTPNAAMLQAIQKATLFDDGYGEDTTTINLEASMASLTGHEAGLFLLSGTMGNQVAIRSILTQPPHAVLCDYRAHILTLEAGGIAMMCGAMVSGVVPSNEVYLTLADIEKHVVLPLDVHVTPTKVISLENTLRGTIIPLAEVQRISQFARKHDIKMNLDGARLWEAAAAGAGTLRDYAECFDSVTMCFSKGLGAPVGSILVGSLEFIKRARWIRQAIGGSLRQAGVLTSAAQAAVGLNFGTDGAPLRKAHTVAKRIEAHWKSLGGEVEAPVETNMVWLNLMKASVDLQKFREMGKERGLKVTRGRIVIHYQTSPEALGRLEELLTEIMSG